MKLMLTACDRCGLRAVRGELEERGIVIDFCDGCYWGEPPALSATRRDRLDTGRAPSDFPEIGEE